MGFTAYTKHVGAREIPWIETLEAKADVGDQEEGIKDIIGMKEAIIFQRHTLGWSVERGYVLNSWMRLPNAL